MLSIYDLTGTGLRRRDGLGEIGEACVWIDLLNPTPEEDDHVERALGLAIPTRAEMREIEASNRVYQENGAHFMTAFILYNIEAPMPSTSTLTFILAGNRLITVRYSEPRAFPMFLQRVDKGDLPCTTGATIMVGLLETIIHRQADLIERIQDEVDKLAGAIFEIKGGQQTRNRRLDVLLRTTGKEGDLTSKAQESAFSLERLLNYLLHASRERREDARIVQRIETAQADIRSLVEHLRFLSERTTFLLDAALGMINIEQNQIIKIFSIASVVLMPPTLVGTVYGMNFKHMPELHWLFGYPMALAMMVVSAVVPLWYFRRRGWL